MDLKNKIIVNFTPTGMIPTKGMTPYVPITVEEIIKDVQVACNLGITMVHLHARDESTGKPTYKKETYAKIIKGIRVFAPELIICVSLSGRGITEFEHRADPLQLEGSDKPDMGSLTLSSLNFNTMASINEPNMIVQLALDMEKKGILPELEAFDCGMINYAKYLLKKNILQVPLYFNLLLGNIAGAQASLLHAGIMINDLPENSIWALAGIGDSQLMMNSIAIASGGGVRVGLEDMIYFNEERTHLAKNEDLLQRIHQIIKANGKTMMESKKLRELLHLNPGFGLYGRKKVI